MQNPKIEVPKRSQFPNWKICPLLKWINHIGTQARLLGMNVSVNNNKMLMRCKGKGTHQDIILWINYKDECGGFQTDALCQEGFLLPALYA